MNISYQLGSFMVTQPLTLSERACRSHLEASWP